MKAIVIALVVLCVVSAALARPALNDRIIDEVNQSGDWVAGHNDRFEGMSLDDVKKLLGTKMDKPMNLPKYPLAVDVEAIPDSFDARTQWPNCIHPIRDQAQCGSCWAFGATEVLSDRFCIASSGKVSVILSPQELVSCDTTDYGCGGGYLDNAWAWMKTHGVPTEACFPYASQSGQAPACSSKCKDGSAKQMYKAKTTYDLSGNVAAIQQEIMKNGPVEVAFDVYQDFFSYKSGVYSHKTGGLAGGHAVKMVGWGVSSGTPYWIVANSWGTSWGQNGFFWIKRGSDECGIESNVVAGLPDVSSVVPTPTTVVNEQIIEEVNKEGEWVAGHNARFDGMTLSDAKKLLGTKIDRSLRLPKRMATIVSPNAIPDSFDARTQWPHCIHPIRDQAQCGSCWAFGATEVLSDRFCIASSGKVSVVLSPQELVSCDTTDYGCGGGYLDNAWAWMKTHGVPTEDCFPYASQSGQAPACSSKCKDGSAKKMYKAKTTYDLSGNVAAIQQEIMKNGPVEVAFDVYQDFFSYKSGVYSHKTGGLAGGHAVKMVGWGVSSGTPYWIVANSWGTSWGQNGFFWIKRGSDECGIESNVVAGLPDVSSSVATPLEIAAPVDLSRPVHDDALIAAVNANPASTWKAGRNPRFEGKTLADVKKLMGTRLDKLPKREPVVLRAASLPASFDARTQWPSCIHPIRDQQQCGSCWAFGATEALSDRLCIASQGSINVVLSPETLVSCDQSDQGCQGGYLENAWDFMADSGVVADSCFPYTAGDGNAPACQSTCSNGASWKPYYVQQGSVQTFSDVESMQTAIYNNGPIEGAFSVYADFMQYTGGVYQHTSGSLMGGHAIKILGWGTENGTPYWLCANSWSTSWGENGFFKIKRGSDECGIEDQAVAGLAKV